MGLFGELLGWDADDERLPGSLPTLRERGVKIRIETVDAGDPHPNTCRLTLRRGQERHFVRAISTGGGMMEVLGLDAFNVSLFGDCFETLLWVRGEGHKLARELATLVSADAILVHEAGGEQLVEMKAGAFVSEQTIARLNGAFAIRTVKRLAPVPRRSRPRQRGPYAGTDRCRLFPRSMIGPRGSGSCRGWKRSSTPTATADVTGCLRMSRGQGKPRPKD
jgi:L-serine dehydratase